MSRNNPILQYMLLLIVGMLMLLAFVGCKVTAPLPMGSTHEKNDSVRTEMRIDTIFRDRWHTEYMRGDTLYIHDSIDRWRIREVHIHDSIDNSRVDTVYQTVEIEKKGNAFLVRSGIALWVIIALIVIAVIAGIVLKFAK